MAFYRPFVVGWQDRVANFLDNVQRQDRGVFNIVEHCWTLFEHSSLVYTPTIHKKKAARAESSLPSKGRSGLYVMSTHTGS